MNSKIKTAIGIIAVGTLVVSLGTGAFAGTHSRNGLGVGNQMNGLIKDSTSDQSTRGLRKEGTRLNGFGARQGRNLKGVEGCGSLFDTDTLVAAGLITSTQATAIKDLISDKEAERLAERQEIESMTQEERQVYFENKGNTVRINLQEELVSNNILTQDEMDKIEAYMQAERLEQHQTELSTALESFVTNNTITQAKADEILAYMKDIRVKNQLEMDALKGKTADEIKEYFDAQQPKVDPLTSLVTDNVITQAQADALSSVFHKGPHGGRGLNR
ncbi:MAG: hypothetical protein CVU84_08115 [Firmicutes bacterium HGW-Firmicutes-1]|jgi:hypothetical protein|nr:MAG: hypothetical protein CVU84_08115 [Firmicutes bacterium HGW-Firmicutes-1]